MNTRKTKDIVSSLIAVGVSEDDALHAAIDIIQKESAGFAPDKGWHKISHDQFKQTILNK